MVKVYALKCVVNEYAYVGCTKYKLAKRMREHRCLLRKKRHACAQMVEDWHQHGEQSFVVEVLQELPPHCSVAAKRAAELKWMERYRSAGKLYNANMLSFQLSPEAREKGVLNAHRSPGNRWTAEANEKRRLTQTGRTHDHGWKISATKKARGQRPSPEACRSGAYACHEKRYGRSRGVMR